MSNHSPGPWKIIRSSHYTGNPEDTTILSIDGADGTTVLSTDNGYSAPSEANALLIAAAPRMHDALAAIADTRIEPYTKPAELCAIMIAIARSAIAEAKGE